MNIFSRHEAFEIEVLDRMNSTRLLEPVVFGGGSMLRLCHELNRFSVDLDFWFIKKATSQEKWFKDAQKAFERNYEITDAQLKRFTALLELRAADFPKRLKIEIRREVYNWDYQKKIAFSKFSPRQVLVNAHTLEQTMKNKIQAFLERGEIRDCFDIEFLIRRGVALPVGADRDLQAIRKKIRQFKEIDFKVKLGSILDKDTRDYYIENKFSFLEEKLTAFSLSLP